MQPCQSPAVICTATARLSPDQPHRNLILSRAYLSELLRDRHHLLLISDTFSAGLVTHGLRSLRSTAGLPLLLSVVPLMGRGRYGREAAHPQSPCHGDTGLRQLLLPKNPAASWSTPWWAGSSTQRNSHASPQSQRRALPTLHSADYLHSGKHLS